MRLPWATLLGLPQVGGASVLASRLVRPQQPSPRQRQTDCHPGTAGVPPAFVVAALAGRDSGSLSVSSATVGPRGRSPHPLAHYPDFSTFDTHAITGSKEEGRKGAMNKGIGKEGLSGASGFPRVWQHPLDVAGRAQLEIPNLAPRPEKPEFLPHVNCSASKSANLFQAVPPPRGANSKPKTQNAKPIHSFLW